MKTGGEEGGCKGGGAGGKGRIVDVVVVVNGNVDGNRGHWQPWRGMWFLLPGEDGVCVCVCVCFWPPVRNGLL